MAMMDMEKKFWIPVLTAVGLLLIGPIYSQDATIPPFDCSEGVASGPYCFLVHNVSLQRSEAEQHCQARSPWYRGRLASVVNETIQSEVLDLMTSSDLTDAWVGGQPEPYVGDQSYMAFWKWVINCGRCATNNEELMSAMMVTQGCYKEWDNNPEFSVEASGASYPMRNATQCVEWCREDNFAYAGLRLSRCYCSNVFGTIVDGGPGGDHIADPLVCGNACDEPGNFDNFYCGGRTANYIYSTDMRAQYGWWGQYEPYIVGMNEHCGALHQASGFYFAAQNCIAEHGYICQFEGDCNMTAPEGDFETIQGQCVYISPASPSPRGLSWDQSRQACIDMGGDLLTVPDEAFHEDLKDDMNRLRPDSDMYYYIGLRKVIWYWGREDGDFYFTNFDNNEPQGDQLYLHRVSNTSLVWRTNHSGAGEELPSICQIDTRYTPDITTTIDPEATTEGDPSKPTDSTTSIHSNSSSTVRAPTSPGAVTQDEGGLSPGIIAVIVICCVLGAIIFSLLVGFCVYKYQQPSSRVSPEKTYNATEQAATPDSGPIGPVDDGYNSMGGSTTGLLADPKAFHSWTSMPGHSSA